VVVVAAVPTARRSVQVRAAKEQMMWEALKDAIDEEMEADPTVCMMGI
jgi:pyruvate dehydrogenase E1 component beta subunit